jgi:ArsR family transcriptional regulator
MAAKRATDEADDSAQLALLCKALAHPARVQILRLLVKRDACVCGDIVDALPLAQSTVSEHLRVLREAGLVSGEIEGPRVCYCVNKKGLAEIERLFGKLFGT